MKRTVLAASLGLAALIPVATAEARAGCDRLFTVKMGERAAIAIYSGTKPVGLKQLRVLGYIERCQRNPAARGYVRSFDHHQAAMRRERINQARIAATMSYATASWYNDAGTTASGYHAGYGVATCGDQTGVCYPFGTKITFYYGGRSVTAVVDDHGPYANGASFDLNQNTASALGFTGVDTVGYSVG